MKTWGTRHSSAGEMSRCLPARADFHPCAGGRAKATVGSRWNQSRATVDEGVCLEGLQHPGYCFDI